MEISIVSCVPRISLNLRMAARMIVDGSIDYKMSFDENIKESASLIFD